MKKRVKNLKPYLFCGGTPELRETGDLKQYYVYKCSKCGKTPVRWYEARLFAWSARRIWNKRSKK